jgi:hypothetical protein
VGALAKGADAVTRLGLEQSKIRTYEEWNKITSERYKERVKEQQKGLFGVSYPGLREIFYRETNKNAPVTVTHEGGHVGREIVRESGKELPTLQGYAASSNPSLLNTRATEDQQEELSQRMLDIKTSDRLLKQGLITQEDYDTRLSRNRKFLERETPANKAELARHLAIDEKRAQQILTGQFPAYETRHQQLLDQRPPATGPATGVGAAQELDRSVLDRSLQNEVSAQVNGGATVSVDVKTPNKVGDEPGGLFKQEVVERQTNMDESERGSSVEMD